MSSTPYKDRFEEEVVQFHRQTSELLSQLNTALSDFKNEYKKIQSQQETATSKIEEIDSVKAKIEQIHSELSGIKDEISGKSDDENMSIYDDIVDSQEQITKMYEATNTYYKALFGYEKPIRTAIDYVEYNRLEDDEKETKNGKYFKITKEPVKGEAETIKNLTAEYQKELEAEKNRILERDESIKQQIKEWKDSIDSLLPSGTAVSLTAAYEDARKAAEESIKNWSQVFFAALAVIVIEGLILLWCGVISFNQNATITETLIQVIRMLGFEAPALWLAGAANIKVWQYTRLREEYRHKCTMSQTFNGMKKEILAHFSDENDKNIVRFYASMLDAFSYNASKALDKDNRPWWVHNIFGPRGNTKVSEAKEQREEA